MSECKITLPDGTTVEASEPWTAARIATALDERHVWEGDGVTQEYFDAAHSGDECDELVKVVQEKLSEKVRKCRTDRI